MSRAADLLEHVGRVGIRNAHARRPDGLHPLVHLLFIFSREHHTLAAGVRKDEGEGPHGLVITRPHVALVEEHDAIGFVAESEEVAGRLEIHQDIVAQHKPSLIPLGARLLTAA